MAATIGVRDLIRPASPPTLITSDPEDTFGWSPPALCPSPSACRSVEGLCRGPLSGLAGQGASPCPPEVSRAESGGDRGRGKGRALRANVIAGFLTTCTTTADL